MSSQRNSRPKLTKEQRLSENKRLRIKSKDFNAFVSRLKKEHQSLLRLTKAVCKGGKVGAKTASGKTVHKKDLEKINHEYLTEFQKLSKHYSAALHKKRPPTPGGQNKCVRAKYPIRRFFNEVNTPDVDWDTIMKENGPNAELLKSGVTNNKVLTNLFTLWYFSCVLPSGSALVSHNKEGKSLVSVMDDPLFKDCFGATMRELENRPSKDGKKFDPYNFKYKHFRNIISMNVFKKGETEEVLPDGKKSGNPVINETKDLKDTLDRANTMVVDEKLTYRKKHPTLVVKKPAAKKRVTTAATTTSRRS